MDASLCHICGISLSGKTCWNCVATQQARSWNGQPKRTGLFASRMRLSRKTQIVLVCTAGIILFVFAGTIVSSKVANSIRELAPSAESDPAVSGLWQFEAQNGSKHPAIGKMLLEETGPQVIGRACDNYGNSLIHGEVIMPDRIRFSKQYIAPNGRKIEGSIIYDGFLALSTNGALTAKGVWSMSMPQKSSGSDPLHGQWFGQLVQPSQHMASPAVSPLLPQANNRLPHADNTDLSCLRDKFTMAVVVILSVVLLLVWLSVKVFAPDGLLSQQNMRQYIPSRFQGRHEKLRAEWAKPLKEGGIPLGRRHEWHWWCPWQVKDLAVPPAQRTANPHMLVLGLSNKGKTRMLARMIAHDIESADRAVVVVDSDGALVELMTKWIAAHPKAKEFASRTTIIDPTYKGASVGYNPLELPEDGDLLTAASAVVYGFKAIYAEPPGAQSQWNAQTAHILQNAALLLMANGKTLVDLPVLLQDNDFRDVLLKSVERRKNERVEFSTLLEAWGQYKKQARTDQWINWAEPILNRVGPALGDPRVRPLLIDPENSIRIKDAIRDKSILFVKIPQGHVDQKAQLLGSLIVTGLKQAAISLAAKRKQAPVALYLDELDRFIEKETLKSITSETRNFQIGLVGATKTLQNIPDDFRHEILVHMGIINCFALTKKDADMLAPQMFRVSGSKERHQTLKDFFTPISNNAGGQGMLISDEEKLNIDRVVGQEQRTFFSYRNGMVAAVFHMRAHKFPDAEEKQIKWELIEAMHVAAPLGAPAKDTVKRT